MTWQMGCSCMTRYATRQNQQPQADILDRLRHRCSILEFASTTCRLKEGAAFTAITPESSKRNRLAMGGDWA